MSRPALAACALAAAVASGGCQTFIGVEDVDAHLPRLDGMYLLGIHRVRAADGRVDVLRLRTMAHVDRDARTLDLAFVVLGFGTDTAVSEGSINGIEFPPDGATATFAFNLQVSASAVSDPPPTGADQSIDVPEMLLRAEAEYSFCAVPAAGGANPSFGTVLVAAGAPLPVDDRVDTDCDE